MQRPSVGGRRAFDRLPLVAHRLHPRHQLDVVCVLTEQAQDVLGLGAGGDALGGEVGLVRVDRQQRATLAMAAWFRVDRASGESSSGGGNRPVSVYISW
jgi:hypothetical protein